ncbi:CHRD domain-containing protein [Bailinhaonella thermotolerans]|uniref:CHRD domain-containing protein n=1 Tax=Bailinhaonella thermotolerans TaxID=1070861 RepID=A0A3A4ARS1_9ACTN|nr:CHRD domain-containing protein [Bailinhaonella thermotolerans]RJL29974.1 CHRD domain-containing protein [Bailinhaonella thermotolerans]
MSARKFVMPAIALTGALAASAGTLAFALSDRTAAAGPAAKTVAAQADAQAGVNAQVNAQPNAQGDAYDPHAGHGAAVQPAQDAGGAGATARATYFAAALNGANEVPGNDGKAVGDRDGKATALVRIQGDVVSFAIRWDRIAAPSAAHLHLGGKGANGAVKVPFFAAPLPGSARAATGSVKIADAALLDRIRGNPGGFYFNLHTGEFPGGAVRGQLVRLGRAVDLDGVLKRGPLNGPADARQEAPNPEGKRTGDPDGTAFTSVRPWGNCVEYAFRWKNVAPPTVGHLHRAPAGSNGPVVADLFAAEKGLPPSINGLSGIVEVPPALVKRVNANPANYYTNLHTAEFPGGAVRGQLSRGQVRPLAVNLAVVKGAQIYRCTPQRGGGFAFTQHDVAARLQGNVRHDFVAKAAGPPRWIAPDGGAVTGKVAARIPNGAGNIPELVLDATRIGAPGGVFSAATTILRLNTAGGVAPAGPCRSGDLAQVPYQADYLFLS